MIPDNEFEYPGTRGNFREPDSLISSIPLLFYTRGPTQFGLPVNSDFDIWRGQPDLVGGLTQLVIRNDTTAEQVLTGYALNSAADEFTFAFERNGGVVFAESFQATEVHYVRLGYTNALSARDELLIPYAYYPWLVLDEWRDEVDGDVCFFYVVDDVLWLRYSSEFFATAHRVGRFDGCTGLGPVGINDLNYMQVTVHYESLYRPRFMLC